jgi:predicted membrane protein
MWTMELVLVWAVCVVIVGIGFCGRQLTKLTLKEKAANVAGNVFFGIMCLLAGLLIYSSLIVQTVSNR